MARSQLLPITWHRLHRIAHYAPPHAGEAHPSAAESDSSYSFRTMTKKRRRRESTSEVACPFCGAVDEIFVDPGGGAHQTYVEDCAVCCHPRVVHVEPGEGPGEVTVWLERG